jgi:hypothetical protein
MAADSIVTKSRHLATSPLMERLAAVGFFVYGGVYVLVGTLAAKVALGTGGRITSSEGAILEVAREPFGNILLLVIMLGLLAYSSWRLTQAIADPEGKGKGVKGLVVRSGRFVSAISYGALALFTLEVVLGARRTSGDKNWALRLLTDPLGAVFGTLIGLIILAVAVAQFYKAYTAKFGEAMHRSGMTQTERCWGDYAARLGFSARGLVFALTGGYLLYAVFDANPSQVKSVDELLLTLLRLPYGHWILAVVALGLAGYGMFMILVSIHRRHPY